VNLIWNRIIWFTSRSDWNDGLELRIDGGRVTITSGTEKLPKMERLREGTIKCGVNNGGYEKSRRKRTTNQRK